MSTLYKEIMRGLLETICIEQGIIPVEEVPNMPGTTYRVKSDAQDLVDYSYLEELVEADPQVIIDFISGGGDIKELLKEKVSVKENAADIKKGSAGQLHNAAQEHVDYTEWRKENLEDKDVETLSKEAEGYSKKAGEYKQ